jgi:hypothetical protein
VGEKNLVRTTVDERFQRRFIPPGVFLHISNTLEALAKLLKAVENRHSGQAKRDPESRIFKLFWIPAFAGMTE